LIEKTVEKPDEEEDEDPFPGKDTIEYKNLVYALDELDYFWGDFKEFRLRVSKEKMTVFDEKLGKYYTLNSKMRKYIEENFVFEWVTDNKYEYNWYSP